MQLLILLNEYEVRYLLAWGFGENEAASVMQSNADFGIWIDPQDANKRRLLSVLLDMGYDPEDLGRLRMSDFFDPFVFSLHLPSGLVADFMTTLGELCFEHFADIYEQSPVLRLDDMSVRMLESGIVASLPEEADVAVKMVIKRKLRL